MLRDRDKAIIAKGNAHTVYTFTVDYQSPDERQPVGVYGVMKDNVTGRMTLASITDINPEEIILDKTVLVPVVRRGMCTRRDPKQSNSPKGKEGNPHEDRTYNLSFRPPIESGVRTKADRADKNSERVLVR